MHSFALRAMSLNPMALVALAEILAPMEVKKLPHVVATQAL